MIWMMMIDGYRSVAIVDLEMFVLKILLRHGDHSHLDIRHRQVDRLGSIRSHLAILL